ncbi:kinase-like protein [Aspergillus keveii]|uniref:Kinase-like protein n=1 Tax=Aspergillus keveii TaxID=714993 RepID=A0ABR4FHI2_9EURO
MAAALAIGQTLKGKVGTYFLAKQLQEGVWLALNQKNEKVLIKSVRHFRIQNERDVLLRFQGRTTHLRRLLDEGVDDGLNPPSIVLKYLDDDLLRASHQQRLTPSEVKYVAKGVLSALAVLHADGFVHTDIKPSNVLVNYGSNEGTRFAEVQLADFGSTIHRESGHAVDADQIGTPIFRRPEAQLSMRWDTSTDIWSFGGMLISLLYGEGFHIFKPDVPADHDEYDLKIPVRHHQVFGPFPPSYDDIADQDRRAAIIWIMQNTPVETLRPFHRTTPMEITAEDKEFVLEV